MLTTRPELTRPYGAAKADPARDATRRASSKRMVNRWKEGLGVERKIRQGMLACALHVEGQWLKGSGFTKKRRSQIDFGGGG